MKAVAIGGGHGTAVTLHALRTLTDEVTGVVSVADNGGSTGRLRRDLDVAAVGDLRKCLLALSDPTNDLTPILEHRFRVGDLEGHAFGNLLLAGLLDATGDLESSVRAMGRLLNITGVVLPASVDGVDLVARTSDGRATGQVEVSASGTIRTVATVPSDVRAPASVLDAIAVADLVVIGPGSLYTSVLAAGVVPGISEALAASSARRVYVVNLHEQVPETEGYSVGDHVAALTRHHVCADVVLLASTSSLRRDTVSLPVIEADLQGANRFVHSPRKLALELSRLVA
jgi:uncharacterized cofD-like protein